MARLFDITAGQDHETKLALQKAGVELEHYLRIKNDPVLAAKVADILRATKLGYPARDYSRYSSYLLSLESQLGLLRELNGKLPSGLRVSDAWLDLDTASRHVQSVEDLEHFFIVLDTLEKTFAVNWELVKLTQPRYSRFRSATNVRSLRLRPNHIRWYVPGIHRVRVNLIDNWAPEEGRGLGEIYTQIVGTDILLASMEPVGAYGLHADLLRQQNGTDLPHAELAGLVEGPFDVVPRLGYDYRGGGAYLDLDERVTVSKLCTQYYAAPSLQGVQN